MSKGYTEVEVPEAMLVQLPPHVWCKKYTRGNIKAILTLVTEDGFHLSISHKYRQATLKEILHANRALIPKGTMMDFVNAYTISGSNVTHLWEKK